MEIRELIGSTLGRVMNLFETEPELAKRVRHMIVRWNTLSIPEMMDMVRLLQGAKFDSERLFDHA